MKQTILELAEQNKNLNRKRVAMVTYKDIDEALSKWAQEMKRNNIMITASAVKEKAEEIAMEMGQDFKPSAGWLYKWKERENVQFGKKPKVAEQLEASLGNEDILKGLLERGDDMAQQECKKFKASSDDQEERHNITESQEDFHGFSDPTMSYGNVNNSQDFNCSNLEERKDDKPQPSLSAISTTSPPPSAKKVPYSYDPVYVLTSTGRYRKEKTFLTLLQKLEILQRLKNGEKRPDLINEYRLSQSAMSQIVADEKKIMKLAAVGQNLQMKRVRGGIFKGGEEELNTWVLKKIDEGETLTRTQVKNKAKEIAERLNIDFKASSGWLEKWKARMNMDFNESQILHRKIPSYISQTDEETHISDETHMPEAIYGDDDDDPVDVKKELADAEEYSFDDEPQFLDISSIEPDDVKPIIIPTPSPPVTPVPAPQPPVVTETLHQKILNWLSKHNIGPTASIELLTILHPVITETCKNTIHP